MITAIVPRVKQETEEQEESKPVSAEDFLFMSPRLKELLDDITIRPDKKVATEQKKEEPKQDNKLEFAVYQEKPTNPSHDTVNHPKHYMNGGIETIDFIEAKGLDFCLGNVVKYVARAGHKGDKLEDLKKARWYLDREIESIENNHE